MSRNVVSDGDTTLDQAPLLAELKLHARQHAEWFFLYLFYLRYLVDYVNLKFKPKSPLRVLDAYRATASHQLGSGFDRSASDRFEEFDQELLPPNPTTAGFKRTAAAHFCNLGVAPSFSREVA